MQNGSKSLKSSLTFLPAGVAFVPFEKSRLRNKTLPADWHTCILIPRIFPQASALRYHAELSAASSTISRTEFVSDFSPTAQSTCLLRLSMSLDASAGFTIGGALTMLPTRRTRRRECFSIR